MTAYPRSMQDNGLQGEVGAMMMPLAMLPDGAFARIVEVSGGRGLVRRLAELGFNADVLVKVLHNHSPGPVLIEVKGSRVALGRGVAMKILVEEAG